MESKSCGVLDTRFRGYDVSGGDLRSAPQYAPSLARRLEPFFGE
jgi:hypothetical protein